MTDTKTFKDISASLKTLVDETKANFKITKKNQEKLDEHAEAAAEKLEKNQKPRSKVQKEMLRVLETQAAQDKVRAREQTKADFQMGKATLDMLKQSKLSKADLMKAGFSNIGSTMETIRQSWQNSVGAFKTTVKNWWASVKENSRVLKIAKDFWNSKAVQKFREIGSSIVATIGGHMREVLGEFAEVFDIMKKTMGAIFSGITGAFKSVFGRGDEKRKEKREKKMESHLQKIKDGIGFLVKGEKLDDLSGGAKKKKGLLDGIKGMVPAFSMAGLGGFLMKAGLIAFLGKMLVDAVKGAIQGYFDGGIAGASTEFLVGISKLPRMITAWVLEQFGMDKLAAKIKSDEHTREFIDKMNKGIQDFIDSIVGWFKDSYTKLIEGLANLWNSAVDTMIPDKIGFGPFKKDLTEWKESLKAGSNDAVEEARAAQGDISGIGKKGSAEDSLKYAQAELQKRKNYLKEVGKQGKDADTSGVGQAIKDMRELTKKIAELSAQNSAIAVANSQGGGNAAGTSNLDRIPGPETNLVRENSGMNKATTGGGF